MPMFFHNKGQVGIAPNAFEQISKDSDRAVAIVGAAIVEDRLTDFLKTRCASGIYADKLAKNFFSSRGPLGNFGAKIDAAFLFQQISAEAHEDLQIIKDIRNRFAHRIDIDRFDDDDIAIRCRKLHLVEEYIKDIDEQELKKMEPLEAGSLNRQVLLAYKNARKDLDDLRERFVTTVVIFNFFLGSESGDGWTRPAMGPVI